MGSTEDADIFGRVRMGYFVVGSQKMAEWKQFAVDAIGLHLAFESSTELAFRMDDHARRIIVEYDTAEDITAVGWQVDNHDVLQIILQRLADSGVTVGALSDEEAARRGVESAQGFVGPKGLKIELFVTPKRDEAPPSMLISQFQTGAAGMGHMSIMACKEARNIDFWQTVFNARISDTIALAVGNRVAMNVTFMRFNERHHSVAIAATQGISLDMFRTRVQHFNIEVATLDDLSEAYERCNTLGCKVARTVGQHPNDKELSFYVETPSGFDLEIGWDALLVNEEHWQEGKSYPNMSNWGHDIPGLFSSELGFRHIVQGVRSLMRDEYLPW